MKTRITALFLAVIMFILCGCSNATPTSSIQDTDFTFFEEYQNYTFWENDNQLRLIIPFSGRNEISDTDDFPTLSNKSLPNQQMQIIKKLRQGIISYFLKNYQIDLSEKIANQNVVLFSNNSNSSGITLGYVNIKDSNTLYLHDSLLSINADLFNNTYIHETMHQLGINNQNDSMIMEGIADAFTDLILTEMGITSYPTDYYSDSRNLAHQIIAVDKELPHFLFETKNFSICKRITKKLQNIPQPYEKTNEPGEILATLGVLLYQNQTGNNTTNISPIIFAFEAQEIVKAYCQTFKPDKSTIDYIRTYYLINNFENLKIEESSDGYSIIE